MNEHGGVRVSTDLHVLRAASGQLAAGIVWIGVLVLLGWLGISGRWEAFARAAPWALLVAWLAYISQWRPKVVIERKQLRIVNGLRTHVVPYAAIEGIEARYSVIVRLKDRNITCWGAPMPSSSLGVWLQARRARAARPFVMLPSHERIFSAPDASDGRGLIVAAWQEYKNRDGSSGGGEPVTEWSLVPMAAGTLLLGCILAAILWAR